MSCPGKPDYLPPWLPQNPAYSHDPNGWVNCTAYAGAMAAAYDSCGREQPSGARVRAGSERVQADPVDTAAKEFRRRVG